LVILAPKALAQRIIKLIWKKKAEDIVLLNLKKISDVADYFVICSVGSDRQARVVADAVVEGLKGKDVVLHVEGYETARWILIDCLRVVLHIFIPVVRDYYGLERLWGDALREEFPDGV
jgi:ribosome-associated protein